MAHLEMLVNGSRRGVDVDPEVRLLEVLRDVLDLTGTKYGCGEGQCGACTVLVEGKPTRSCLTPAAAVTGRAVTTIEGLEREGRLDAVQDAFIAKGAMQCGYCTPGMIVEAFALLGRKPSPSGAEIMEAMDAHLCRCGAHPRILDAIQEAALRTKGQG